ncbi:hypothetical protein [Corynebacterium macginleyi]|uniref:hypothetical protein n=1 Tax=Corynebacterium macginleyi TaxID=38290 RepID=UPI001932DF66|nr:hypothetical protein [Corynebacterium macginleyi]
MGASYRVEDPEWTRRYHSTNLEEKAFGGKAVITFKDGTVIEDERAGECLMVCV